jgi:ATP/maltotriose-dependent transcriptional regulator MalT
VVAAANLATAADLATRIALRRRVPRTALAAATAVKTHVGNLLAKLGCRDRTQAVYCAYEHGIVTPGPDHT